jgi:beta-N-acetylhexosaminidase
LSDSEGTAPSFAPVIFGLAGARLSSIERDFFQASKPLGFILFARNCLHPEQLRALTGELRECLARDAPILIDQEGGRVARLGPPHWRKAPAAAVFGRLFERDPALATALAHDNARLIAAELFDAGIDVNCSPVLDVPAADGHAVIGDRAFCSDPHTIAQLGLAVAQGLLAGGVLPVIKHIPGHGRARADSHLELPVVSVSHSELSARDFIPFRALADQPLAMTAHVVYSDLDPGQPATTSPTVIAKVIRGEMQFDGVLLSDDIGMQALSGGLAGRARSALAAGCDLVLHCSGELSEMRDIASALPAATPAARSRVQTALKFKKTPEPFDRKQIIMRLEQLSLTG